jgi:hypothetical protein
MSPRLAELTWSPLPQCQKIVHEHVDVREGVSGGRGRAGGTVGANGPSEALQGMRRGKIGLRPGVVDEIGGCLRCGAEVRCRFYEAHG